MSSALVTGRVSQRTLLACEDNHCSSFSHCVRFNITETFCCFTVDAALVSLRCIALLCSRTAASAGFNVTFRCGFRRRRAVGDEASEWRIREGTEASQLQQHNLLLTSRSRYTLHQSDKNLRATYNRKHITQELRACMRDFRERV